MHDLEAVFDDFAFDFQDDVTQCLELAVFVHDSGPHSGFGGWRSGFDDQHHRALIAREAGKLAGNRFEFGKILHGCAELSAL